MFVCFIPRIETCAGEHKDALMMQSTIKSQVTIVAPFKISRKKLTYELLQDAYMAELAEKLKSIKIVAAA